MTFYNRRILEFLQHSNWIEKEYSQQALIDAKAAWDFMFDSEFTINNLLDTHKLLLKNLRPDIAGRFRKCDVFIGGERKKFIHESRFKEQLEILFRTITTTYTVQDGGNKKIKEDTTKKLHVEFENIHPFEDGNGRVGRILWQIHRLRLGIPLKIIHIGEEQLRYYAWFNNSLKYI